MNLYEALLKSLLLAWYESGCELPPGDDAPELRFRANILDGLRLCADIDPNLYEDHFTEFELRRPWPQIDDPNDDPPKAAALRRIT